MIFFIGSTYILFLYIINNRCLLKQFHYENSESFPENVIFTVGERFLSSEKKCLHCFKVYTTSFSLFHGKPRDLRYNYLQYIKKKRSFRRVRILFARISLNGR